MFNDITKKIVLTVLAAASVCAVIASETIVNLSSPITVNAFFQWSDTLWVATSGGLQIHDLRTGNTTLVANSRTFPDLHLTAVARDERGNMWIGSRKGYLYRRTPRGQFTVFSNYKLSDWGITSLLSFDGLLVVGSNRGVSLFDPVKGLALRNATNIADFVNQRVNAITASVMGDTLFLGCDEGVAYIDNLIAEPLSQRNFYYSGIWKTKRVGRVASFVQMPDSVMAVSTPAVMFSELVYRVLPDLNTRVVAFDTRGRTVVNEAGDTIGLRLPGSGGITALFNEGGRRLWVGTADAFYYSVEGNNLLQHRMDGFTLRRVSRVEVDAFGNAWFLPVVPVEYQWHHGVYRYSGNSWYLYNNNTHHDQFGYVGDGSSLAFARGLGGTVWVGMSGGNIKHINPTANTVSQLIVGYSDFSNFNYVVNNIGDVMWGKVDALAVDTSGFLWISVFDSHHGSLICYDQRHPPVSSLEHTDPVRARYRRFFTEPPLLTKNISQLSVDRDNRVFAYDEAQNRLTVFSHNGNPLADGIVIDTVYVGFGIVSAIETGDDGTVYIAGAGELMKVERGSLHLQKVGDGITNITSMAIWGSVMWLGTQTNGILRYDVESGERRWIDESSGLSSNIVGSVAIDKSRGRLWAVTDDGVSQIDVGRAVSSAPREKFRAFPNVFSISGINQGVSYITFAGLAPNSSVSVYTLNGSLVENVDARHFTDHEWRAVWTPRRGLTPGTYIVTTRPSGKRTKIILRP